MRAARQMLLVLAAVGSAAGATQLLPDFPIYTAAAGEAPTVADASYNGGRLADATALVAGGGRAAVFNPGPWGGIQWYIKWPLVKLDGRKYAGLAFKLAAAAEFAPEVTVGVQVLPSTPKGVPLKAYLAGGRARQAWQSVFVPLGDLQAGAALASTTSFYWQDSSGKQQPRLFLTDVVLASLPPSCGRGGSGLPPTRPPPPPPRPQPPRPRLPPSPPPSPRQLVTRGNAIFWPNGTRFAGRGVNLFDTRSCGACAGSQSVAEAKRRIDFAVSQMGTTLLRLALEARVLGDPTDQYNGAQYCQPDCLVSAAYIADVRELVRYAGEKHPQVQVLLSIWQTRYAWGETGLGWPSPTSIGHLRKLVRAVAEYPWVWFGVVNEPEQNFDGALDAQVWQAMDDAVAAVRAEEAALGVAPHLVAVQGTRAWARSLAYYASHPIAAGGGTGVVYESHPYNAPADWDALFIGPSAKVPVVVGEFGPVAGAMTQAQAQALMVQLNALGLPWTAWSMHHNCPPSMLVNPGGAAGCGVGMALQLNAWGQLVKQHINA